MTETPQPKRIPVAKPTLGEAEARAAGEAILSGWVTQGPRVGEFEKRFAEYVGAPHACAVSSCTAALHVGLIAVGVRPGDVVLTVSHSFIATANAIRHCGAEPVFVDVDPDTRNMDPGALERTLAAQFERRDDGLWFAEADRLLVGECPLIGRRGPVGRLGAILVVHQVGLPADLARIAPLASQCSVPLVEDAACAIGSEISLDEGKTWQRVGRPVGDAVCFSFHPRKVITTGDGGMVTTASEEIDARLRLLRQHGMGVSDVARHASRQVVFEQYLTTGYNYRMTDIQAAVGIEQLKRLPDILARRRELAAAYARELADISGVTAPIEPAWARTNWQSYVVRLDDPARQRPVLQAMEDRGVSARRGVMSSHLEAPYAPAWPAGSLPGSELASGADVILPLYAEMTDADVARVVTVLREALQAAGA